MGPMETVCYREVSATVRGYTCTLHYLYQRFRLINIYIVDRSVGGGHSLLFNNGYENEVSDAGLKILSSKFDI